MFTSLLILPALFATPATTDAPVVASTDAGPTFESSMDPLSPYYAPFEPARPFAVDDVHDSRWYLRVNAGAVSTNSSDGPDDNIDFNEGWLAAAAIGERVTDGTSPVNFALELEGVWTKQDADSNDAIDDVATIGAYLNGVFDFRLAERFSIYAGAGIGAAWMNVGTKTDSLNDFSDDDGPFLTWQLKAGLMWSFSDNLALTLGYRFRNIDDNQLDNNVDDSSFDLQTEQHVAEIGLQFGF